MPAAPGGLEADLSELPLPLGSQCFSGLQGRVQNLQRVLPKDPTARAATPVARISGVRLLKAGRFAACIAGLESVHKMNVTAHANPAVHVGNVLSISFYLFYIGMVS